MIITITGALGSGKSTVAKAIASELSYKHYSTGDFMRQMAKDKGISLLDLTKIADTDRSVDDELDNWQIKLGKEEDDFVIDGRLSWHFIPNSIKIFLGVTEEEGAQRIFDQKRSHEADNSDYDKTLENIKIRKTSEQARYLKLYNVDLYDLSGYDIIIDTSGVPAEEVIKKVLEGITKITGQ